MADLLARLEGVTEFGTTRAGRYLQAIYRDTQITDELMRGRRRNEEVLSLSYHDGITFAANKEWENVRENALNLPWRYMRWIESQFIGKNLVIKVNRDAGPGQVPGGPGDDATGMWHGITLERAAYEGGLRRELTAMLNEVVPRGTSVLAIGYHEEEISLQTGMEVGKTSMSVFPEAVGQGDVEAKPGQDHLAIAEGLGQQANNPDVQLTAGREGVDMAVTRKESHEAAVVAETEAALAEPMAVTQTRMVRRKVWIRKRRVGEDVGWAPYVYDTEDTPFWWDRHMWTVAEVKKSDLFTDEFKSKVQGMDSRVATAITERDKLPSEESMDSDSRQAATEEALTDDEKMVEWFAIWIRKPDIPSGGIRKIVCAETPEMFCEADDRNPHVDEDGKALIPNFFPFYDFTPLQSSLTVPARTKGIPPIAPGMTQFEKLAEYNRIRQEAALKGATRLYQLHPGVKENKKLLDAINKGQIGYAFIAGQELMDGAGKMQPAVHTVQFTGSNPEIHLEAAREESDWVKVQGMPPAVLQGMGTAETATQDAQGIAAGERESNTMISYFQYRLGDVFRGLSGLIRGNYDGETFTRMLGDAGAQVMSAWQKGSLPDGDEIEVFTGTNAQAQEIVDKKQLMEAITLEKGEVDPVSGLSKYDHTHLFEELHRRLDVGPPRVDDGPMRALQEEVLQLRAVLEQLMGQQEDASPSSNGKSDKGSGGPSPSEGDGPTAGNLNAGARRGTSRGAPQGANDGQTAGAVSAAR